MLRLSPQQASQAQTAINLLYGRNLHTKGTKKYVSSPVWCATRRESNYLNKNPAGKAILNSRNKKLNEWDLTRARFHIADRFPPKPLRKEKDIETILSNIMREEQQTTPPELPEELLSRWSLVAGEQIAKHTEPAYLREGILTVHADHPGWLSEVRRLPQAHLLKKLASIPSLPAIHKIRFQLNPAIKTWKNKT